MGTTVKRKRGLLLAPVGLMKLVNRRHLVFASLKFSLKSTAVERGFSQGRHLDGLIVEQRLRSPSLLC